jgi:hypothetical protein
MSAEIDAQASRAVESADSLARQGFERDEFMRKSKEEWVAGLTRSYWFFWVSNLLFLIIGLLSTYLLFKDRGAWIYLVAAASGLNLLLTIPPTVELANGFESISRFVAFWLNTIPKEGLGPFYVTFFWPFYSLILLGLSIYSFLVLRPKRRLT